MNTQFVTQIFENLNGRLRKPQIILLLELISNKNPDYKIIQFIPEQIKKLNKDEDRITIAFKVYNQKNKLPMILKVYYLENLQEAQLNKLVQLSEQAKNIIENDCIIDVYDYYYLSIQEDNLYFVIEFEDYQSNLMNHYQDQIHYVPSNTYQFVNNTVDFVENFTSIRHKLGVDNNQCLNNVYITDIKTKPHQLKLHIVDTDFFTVYDAIQPENKQLSKRDQLDDSDEEQNSIEQNLNNFIDELIVNNPKLLVFHQKDIFKEIFKQSEYTNIKLDAFDEDYIIFKCSQRDQLNKNKSKGIFEQNHLQINKLIEIKVEKFNQKQIAQQMILDYQEIQKTGLFIPIRKCSIIESNQVYYLVVVEVNQDPYYQTTLLDFFQNRKAFEKYQNIHILSNFIKHLCQIRLFYLNYSKLFNMENVYIIKNKIAQFEEHQLLFSNPLFMTSKQIVQNKQDLFNRGIQYTSEIVNKLLDQQQTWIDKKIYEQLIEQADCFVVDICSHFYVDIENQKKTENLLLFYLEKLNLYLSICESIPIKEEKYFLIHPFKQWLVSIQYHPFPRRWPFPFKSIFPLQNADQISINLSEFIPLQTKEMCYNLRQNNNLKVFKIKNKEYCIKNIFKNLIHLQKVHIKYESLNQCFLNLSSLSQCNKLEKIKITFHNILSSEIRDQDTYCNIGQQFRQYQQILEVCQKQINLKKIDIVFDGDIFFLSSSNISETIYDLKRHEQFLREKKERKQQKMIEEREEQENYTIIQQKNKQVLNKKYDALTFRQIQQALKDKKMKEEVQKQSENTAGLFANLDFVNNDIPDNHMYSNKEQKPNQINVQMSNQQQDINNQVTINQSLFEQPSNNIFKNFVNNDEKAQVSQNNIKVPCQNSIEISPKNDLITNQENQNYIYNNKLNQQDEKEMKDEIQNNKNPQQNISKNDMSEEEEITQQKQQQPQKQLKQKNKTKNEGQLNYFEEIQSFNSENRNQIFIKAKKALAIKVQNLLLRDESLACEVLHKYKYNPDNHLVIAFTNLKYVQHDKLKLFLEFQDSEMTVVKIDCRSNGKFFCVDRISQQDIFVIDKKLIKIWNYIEKNTDFYNRMIENVITPFESDEEEDDDSQYPSDCSPYCQHMDYNIFQSVVYQDQRELTSLKIGIMVCQFAIEFDFDCLYFSHLHKLIELTLVFQRRPLISPQAIKLIYKSLKEIPKLFTLNIVIKHVIKEQTILNVFNHLKKLKRAVIIHIS